MLTSTQISTQISPNLCFDRLLLLKVYRISAKKVLRSYVSWHWREMQKLKKNWFVSIMTRIWWILIQALKSLKNCTFIGPFRAKYITLDLKKYRVMKIWRKTDLRLGKWHEKFSKFSPEHLEVPKLGLSSDPFVQSRKCMSLKFTGELCPKAMKNNEKSEEKLTCYFKIDIRNLTNFDLSTQNPQKFTL